MSSNRERQKKEQQKQAETVNDDFDILQVVRERAAASEALTRAAENTGTIEEGEETLGRASEDKVPSVSSKPTSKNATPQIPDEDTAAVSEEDTFVMEVVAKRALMANEELAMVQPQSTIQAPVATTEAQPGAFAEAPGTGLQRLGTIRFSLLVAANVGRAIIDDGASNTGSSNIDLQQGQLLEDGHTSISPETGGTLPADRQGQGLTEAIPLEDHIAPDLEAKPFDLGAARRRENTQRTKRRLALLLMVALVCIIVAVVVGLVVAKKNKGSAPAMSPTDTPTLAPTGMLDAFFLDLPASMVDRLEDRGTPQWRAWELLQHHPELPTMDGWMKRQWYALATFYYAMEGPKWPLEMRAWIEFAKPECQWAQSWCYPYRADGPTCNEQGEIQRLCFKDLDLTGHQPYIPPEISLLTSLEVISFHTTGMNASISEFLPSELPQVTRLSSLGFSECVLYGTIPSQLGLFTNLEHLHLDRNMLSGSIPTQLGLIRRLVFFYSLQLSANVLSGTIPSQPGLLTGIPGFNGWMFGLGLWDNQLTGTIPTQLMLLPNAFGLHLGSNQLSGPIPSELGLMTYLKYLGLDSNSLSGSLPSEVGVLSKRLQSAKFNDNSLSGKIPFELELLAAHPSLRLLTLENNELSGVFPEELCAMGLYNESINRDQGLSFDCNDDLCGCFWCPCIGRNTSGNHSVYP